jgi:hypothetical protein
MNQHLWNALHDICGFIATQDDMDAIIDAVFKDATVKTVAMIKRRQDAFLEEGFFEHKLITGFTGLFVPPAHPDLDEDLTHAFI